MGNEIRRGAVQEWIGESTDMRMSRRAKKKVGLFLSVYDGNMKMVGKMQNFKPIVENCAKRL